MAGFPLTVDFLLTLDGSLFAWVGIEGFFTFDTSFLGIGPPGLITDDGGFLELASVFLTDVGGFLALAGCLLGVFVFAFIDAVLLNSVVGVGPFLRGGDLILLSPFM